MNQQPQESAVSENSEEVSGNVVGANSKSEGQPAFIVGVTGHMDPTDPERLTRQVEQLFRFLRHGVSGGASGVGATPHQSAASELKAALAPLVEKAPEFPGHSNKVHGDVYERFFAEWPGLGETPIVVLSSLAPGADQIVAKVALQPEFANDYFRLMCPLPVPLEMYRQASTFVRQPQVGATEEELERLKSENDQRVSDLRQLIPDDDDPRCFPVAIRNAFTPGDLSNSLCGATVEEQIELLQDDLDLSEDQRNRLYSHDLKSENRQRRHRRYQAAGEYIAAYSHLLIAIWDHIDDTKNTEGTAGIVHARRTGMTPGLLPTTSDLPLPPDGGVLHIYTTRQRRLDAAMRAGESAAAPDWTLRWLFAQTRSEHSEDLDVARQDAGLCQLKNAAVLLREFTERKLVARNSALSHFQNFLTYNDIPVYDLLKQSGSPLYGMIQRVADFRRRAADEQSTKEAKQATLTRARLFWFALLAAMLLHAFNHWHSQVPHESHAQHDAKHSSEMESTALEASGSSDQKPSLEDATVESEAANESNLAVEVANDDVNEERQVDGAAENSAVNEPSDLVSQEAEPSLPSWLLLADYILTSLLGVAGTVFVTVALLYFYQRRSAQHDEKANDLRAIAEGARVQLIWQMAGLGMSVSANYMSRQRGDLSWIRRTIRSVAMPYERSRWCFAKLAPGLQIHLLRCVAFNWIRGRSSAQANYFRDTQKKMLAQIHFWHKSGAVLVLAGLLVGTIYVLSACLKVAGFDLLAFLSAFGVNRSGYFISAALIMLIALMILLVIYVRSADWKAFRTRYLDHLIHFLVRTRESNLLGVSPERIRAEMKANFFGYLIPALGVSVLTVFWAIFLSNLAQLAPDWELFSNVMKLSPGIGPWMIILPAWLLIAGGLAIAWPERNLYSELAYQYTTMENLFEIAAGRVESMIDELERLHRLQSDRAEAECEACRYRAQIKDDNARASFDLKAKADVIQSDAAREYLQQLRSIQRALFDLGVEALDENAEWLLLHRARPLEPVMAG